MKKGIQVWLTVGFLFVGLKLVTAQEVQLDLLLVDRLTKEEVIGAHAFISNSTIGSSSDSLGRLSFTILEEITEDLIITHLSYDYAVLPYQQIRQLEKGDTVWMVPSEQRLDVISINASRGKKWKQNFELFKKTLLGKDKAASQCEILNPEVLRFEYSDNGNFEATAIEPLEIRNEYLGYDLEFILDKLTVTADQSEVYVGSASFGSFPKLKKKHKNNRAKSYKSSLRKFLLAIIDAQLDEQEFKIGLVDNRNGNFAAPREAFVHELLKVDEHNGLYMLRFDGYLQVEDLKVRVLQEIKDENVRLTGSENSLFDLGRSMNSLKKQPVKSWLHKSGPVILFNRTGHILNKEVVSEYGYWASQKLAWQLPLDYGLTVHNKDSQVSAYSIDLSMYKTLVRGSREEKEEALMQLEKTWHNRHVAAILEILRLTKDQSVVAELKAILKKKLGKGSVPNYYDGLLWLWEEPVSYTAAYVDFKAYIYKFIDPLFEGYFNQRKDQSDIRIDEIVWGGVYQDGIPPLRNPKLLRVDQADYLEDDHIVFGIYHNGIAKAYPKRILAWHEMFIDDFDGEEVAGVYCTLCGTVVPYVTNFDGVQHELGTSGFLYRSNKLMYDRATQSLWNTIEGRPVIGPLRGKEIQLEALPIVTTTWKEWKSLHPQTLVLDIETGHKRDYSEGAAYKEYFATDELMFPVLERSELLENKAEVFVFRKAGNRQVPLAVSVDYLMDNCVFQDSYEAFDFVIISTEEGAIRAYENDAINFHCPLKGKLLDEEGGAWNITEKYLEGPQGQKLKRLAGHNTFWFAWYAQFPNTVLIK